MSELILMLAITCVAEVSFASTQECIYMLRINDQNAQRRGVTLEAHTRRFNSVWKRPPARRPWIHHLRLDGRAPLYWDHSRVSWAKRRRAWSHYIVAIHRYLMSHPRRVRANDYGSPEDARPCEQAVRLHPTRVTLQLYWDINPCWKAKKGNKI